MGRPDGAQEVCSRVNLLNHLGTVPLYLYSGQAWGRQVRQWEGSRQKSPEDLVFIPNPTEGNDSIFCSHWGGLQKEVDSQLMEEEEAAW